MKRAILIALDRFFDFILYGFDSEPGRAQDYHYLRSDESWLKTSAKKPMTLGFKPDVERT